MNMTVEISREKNRFGNCLRLANNQVEVLAAIDYGPRIVSFKRINGENLLFEDTEGFILNNNPEIENAYGLGKVWHGKGGHRFWVAPEKMPFTYYPDDSLVSYEINGKILRFFQDPQVENGIQLIMELMLEEEAKIKVNQNSTEKKGRLKIGISNEEGWGAYINKGQMFKKEFFFDRKGLYPDYGASYETYTDDNIIELESLGCLEVLAPGEETNHEEIWTIHEIPNMFKKLEGE